MTALALASSFCCQGGAFEAGFAGAGVDFDRERGAFRMHRNCVGEVDLDSHVQLLQLGVVQALGHSNRPGRNRLKGGQYVTSASTATNAT